MNHESMSAISGFQAKFTRVIHQFGNEFFLNRMRFQRNKHILIKWIHYLHKSHNTPSTPKKDLPSHCFRLLLGHFHVPGEIANSGYPEVLEGN